MEGIHVVLYKELVCKVTEMLVKRAGPSREYAVSYTRNYKVTAMLAKRAGP